MARKTLLSTYTLRVYDNTNTPVILDNFVEEHDFYKFLKSFFNEVYGTVKKSSSNNDLSILHLTLDEKHETDDKKRAVYGYLSSGIGGDRYTVRDGLTNEKAFEADLDHITYRRLFFYIQIPPTKDYAHVIIQKRRDLGAKNLLEKTLTKYLAEKSFNRYKVKIFGLLDGRVYEKMLTNGNLKRIDLIKRSIPGTLDEYYDRDQKEFSNKGTFTTSIQSHGSLSLYWKNFINGIYLKTNNNTKIELNNGDDIIDEMEFELEFNGKIKTFHVVNKSRTLPDIDVSSEVELENDEPTKSSLIEVCENLIVDVLSLKPLNVTKN